MLAETNPGPRQLRSCLNKNYVSRLREACNRLTNGSEFISEGHECSTRKKMEPDKCWFFWLILS